MRVPASFVKGSGSSGLAVSEPGRVTGQLAPASSTGPAATALTPPVPDLAVAVTNPAIASAATASMTSAGRIFERLELMITWTLSFQFGVAIVLQNFRSIYRNEFTMKSTKRAFEFAHRTHR